MEAYQCSFQSFGFEHLRKDPWMTHQDPYHHQHSRQGHYLTFSFSSSWKERMDLNTFCPSRPDSLHPPELLLVFGPRHWMLMIYTTHLALPFIELDPIWRPFCLLEK